MSKYQPNPRHSLTRGAAAARRLNANRRPAPLAVARVKAVTVDMGEHEERDIISRPGRTGVLYLVRSSLVPTHFYPVTWRSGQYEHTTDERTAAKLIRQIETWLLDSAAA